MYFTDILISQKELIKLQEMVTEGFKFPDKLLMNYNDYFYFVYSANKQCSFRKAINILEEDVQLKAEDFLVFIEMCHLIGINTAAFATTALPEYIEKFIEEKGSKV